MINLWNLIEILWSLWTWTFQSENGITDGITIPSIRWDVRLPAMEAAEENDKSVSTDLKETVQESFNNYQVAGLKTSSYWYNLKC